MKKETPNILLPGLSDAPVHYKKLLELAKKAGIKIKVIDMKNIKKTKKSYTEWVFEKLNRVKASKITLIGVSMGGGIATQYASRFPKKVKKLILVDPLLEKVNFYNKAKRIFKELKRSKINIKKYIQTKRKKEKSQKFLFKELKMIAEMNKKWKQGFNINTKTHLLWGEDDQLTPIKSLKNPYLNFKNKKLIKIPHKTHFILKSEKVIERFLLPLLS